MTQKGYQRLLASASATFIALGLVMLPSDAFANGKATAKGFLKHSPTTTTTIATPPTGTIPTTTSSADHSGGTGGTFGSVNSPQPTTKNEVPGGPGANNQTNNPYASTRNGSKSLNGNGKGNATGKPCAGCVGKADNKNPPGQAPGGSDHNAGYECDRNHGIGRSNPAHTGCTTTTTAPSIGGTTTTTTTTLDVCNPENSTSTTAADCTTTTTTDPCSLSNATSTTAADCTPPTTGGSVAAGHGSGTTTVPGKTAHGSGSLAFTGANLGGELLAGGLALGGGALLLGGSRRRRPSTEPESDDPSTDDEPADA